MRVLLVYPPARDASKPPIGICYLSSYLRQKGHQIEVLDLTAGPLSEDELQKRIEGFHVYDCIGISAIITAYNFVKDFSGKVRKKFPNIPIMVGNAISVSCPRTLLENSAVDVIVVDEGELTVAEVVENIKERKNFINIKGLWFKDEEGNINRTPPRERIKDIDSLPRPAWDLINMSVYIKHSSAYLDRGIRTGWISAVRGCPFRCEYCSRSFGNKVVNRTANSMVDEILEFNRLFKSTHFQMLADLFMANPKMVKSFARCLIERKVDITWECTGRVDLVDEELLLLMRQSNCISVSYGIESGSQKILDNMDKRVTVEQAKRAIELTRKVDLKLKTPFMFGYVGEDRESIADTVNFIKEMKLGSTVLFFSTPYPGTPLYGWAREKNRIKYDEDTYLSLLGNNADKFLVNLTDFSDEELLKLKSDTELKLRRILPFKVKVEKYVIKRAYHIKARIVQLGFIGTVKKIVTKIICL
jgi:radical SAM superfamily enzyme YgiQ (UPF0313 family)|tara:strand:+ start:484 stop:1902 length:1419 start_codon:yes stop_codon:yes gene_type:complete